MNSSTEMISATTSSLGPGCPPGQARPVAETVGDRLGGLDDECGEGPQRRPVEAGGGADDAHGGGHPTGPVPDGSGHRRHTYLALVDVLGIAPSPDSGQI